MNKLIALLIVIVPVSGYAGFGAANLLTDSDEPVQVESDWTLFDDADRELHEALATIAAQRNEERRQSIIDGAGS